MNTEVKIKRLSPSNFSETSLDGFVRTHHVKNVYRKNGNEYMLVEKPYTEEWSIDEKREIAARISGNDFVSYIAIDRECVIGFVALRKELIYGHMILEELHISEKYRGNGIGKKLFSVALEEAQRAGAKTLYISACSSEETIAFYKAMGAYLTCNPISKMVEKEPYDLQMVCECKKRIS